MKHIELLDNAAANGTRYDEIGINRTFGEAYFTAFESGNELLDFAEVIWDEDIEAILENCRRFGIEKFTISSNFSSLTKTIARFLELGCNLEGMTEVKSRFTDWHTREKEILPAFLLSI